MILAIVLSAIAPVIGWLVAGAVIFLISLIQGLETSFKRVFSAVAYTSIISILGAGLIDKIIKLVQGAKTLEEWQRSKISLAALLPAKAHGALVATFSAIDPFAIWGLVVLVIGLTFVNRCKTKSAILTVVIYFILSLAFVAGLGFLGQIFVGGGGEGSGASVTVQA
jgi:hypothetical protein